jgi:hypothetical protein
VIFSVTTIANGVLCVMAKFLSAAVVAKSENNCLCYPVSLRNISVNFK